MRMAGTFVIWNWESARSERVQGNGDQRAGRDAARHRQAPRPARAMMFMFGETRSMDARISQFAR
jgi:hypothetical protein